MPMPDINRRARVREFEGSAIEMDLARITAHRAGENLDHGALACAILADKPMHLAADTFQIRLVEGNNPAIAFGDALQSSSAIDADSGQSSAIQLV